MLRNIAEAKDVTVNVKHPQCLSGTGITVI